jgi:hypothetical protein
MSLFDAIRQINSMIVSHGANALRDRVGTVRKKDKKPQDGEVGEEEEFNESFFYVSKTVRPHIHLFANVCKMREVHVYICMC